MRTTEVRGRAGLPALANAAPSASNAPAREKLRPRRGADVLGVIVGEAHALGRQPVDVGRLGVVRVAAVDVAEVVRAEVVGHCACREPVGAPALRSVARAAAQHSSVAS